LFFNLLSFRIITSQTFFSTSTIKTNTFRWVLVFTIYFPHWLMQALDARRSLKLNLFIIYFSWTWLLNLFYLPFFIFLSKGWVLLYKFITKSLVSLSFSCIHSGPLSYKLLCKILILLIIPLQSLRCFTKQLIIKLWIILLTILLLYILILIISIDLIKHRLYLTFKLFIPVWLLKRI
jgi:hypothetical protein